MANIKNTFVCLDDITGFPMLMNWVIYNPTKQNVDTQIDFLHKIILENFNVDLTDDELIKLSKHDEHHLDEFVEMLKEIINKHREK